MIARGWSSFLHTKHKGGWLAERGVLVASCVRGLDDQGTGPLHTSMYILEKAKETKRILHNIGVSIQPSLT